MNKPTKNYTKIIIGSIMTLGSALKLLNMSSIDAGGARYAYVGISTIMLLAGCSMLYTGLFPIKGTSTVGSTK